MEKIKRQIIPKILAHFVTEKCFIRNIILFNLFQQGDSNNVVEDEQYSSKFGTLTPV